MSDEAISARLMEELRREAQAGDTEAMVKLGNTLVFEPTEDRDVQEGLAWLEKAREAGHRYAPGILGMHYLGSEWVEQDLERALALFEEGASRGDKDALFAFGSLLVNGEAGRKDPAKGRRLIEKAANKGVRKAMYTLATLYVSGIGGKKDALSARKWAEKAARLGDSEAMVLLGLLWQRGKGGKKDHKRALDWFLKASEAGEVRAMYLLGMYYVHEQGGARDVKKGRRWLSKAAFSGYMDAMWELVFLAVEPGPDQDLRRARFWLTQAAEAGDTEAQVALAEFLLLGEGGDCSFWEASKLLAEALLEGDWRAARHLDFMTNDLSDVLDSASGLEEAAEKGNLDAMVLLAEVLSVRSIREPDCDRARQWLARAREADHPPAFILSSIWHRDGICEEEKDHHKAREHLERAAQLGSRKAMFRLGDIAYSSGEDEEARSAAWSWWHQAAEAGDAVAMIHCACMCWLGEGTKQDRPKASEWLWRSFLVWGEQSGTGDGEVVPPEGHWSYEDVRELTESMEPLLIPVFGHHGIFDWKTTTDEERGQLLEETVKRILGVDAVDVQEE